MHPIQVASVFFALTCCFAVFGGEAFSQKSSSDVLKFNLPSGAKMSTFSKRRFRRSSEDKDEVNTNPDEGACNNPTGERDHDIKSYSVSYRRLFIQEGLTLHNVFIYSSSISVVYLKLSLFKSDDFSFCSGLL